MGATSTPASTLSCPDWCTLEPAEHRAEIWEGMVCIDHQGPKIGEWLISNETRDGKQTEPLACGEGDPFSAEELREHAAKAIEAAQWIEAHR